jgi:predicted nucleotidyltransferase component of viral defense system
MVGEMVPFAEHRSAREIMTNPVYGLDSWVEDAPESLKEFRQAIRIILTAVSHDLKLRSTMVMKGGILMGIRYHSERFTTDLDFSTSATRNEIDMEEFEKTLRRSLAMAAADSDYGLDCQLQGCRINPPNDDSKFPNLELKIGYAYKGTPKHKRLMAGQSPTLVKIDFSLNEAIIDIEEIDLGDGVSLQAYALPDLIAEKLRALMQQEKRNRYRRQDIYDLRFLLDSGISATQKKSVLENLITKAQARGIEPKRDSLDDPELRRRAEQEYATLADEIQGNLPDFDESFKLVRSFYRSLPWQ